MSKCDPSTDVTTFKKVKKQYNEDYAATVVVVIHHGQILVCPEERSRMTLI